MINTFILSLFLQFAGCSSSNELGYILKVGTVSGVYLEFYQLGTNRIYNIDGIVDGYNIKYAILTAWNEVGESDNSEEFLITTSRFDIQLGNNLDGWTTVMRVDISSTKTNQQFIRYLRY